MIFRVEFQSVQSQSSCSSQNSGTDCSGQKIGFFRCNFFTFLVFSSSNPQKIGYMDYVTTKGNEMSNCGCQHLFPSLSTCQNKNLQLHTVISVWKRKKGFKLSKKIVNHAVQFKLNNVDMNLSCYLLETQPIFSIILYKYFFKEFSNFPLHTSQNKCILGLVQASICDSTMGIISLLKTEILAQTQSSSCIIQRPQQTGAQMHPPQMNGGCENHTGRNGHTLPIGGSLSVTIHFLRD